MEQQGQAATRGCSNLDRHQSFRISRVKALYLIIHTLFPSIHQPVCQLTHPVINPSIHPLNYVLSVQEWTDAQLCKFHLASPKTGQAPVNGPTPKN
jgi:hypothetical protein